MGRFLAVWRNQDLALLVFPEPEETPEALIAKYLHVSMNEFGPETSRQKELGRAIARFAEGKHVELPRLCLTGTPFQLKVWKALLETPLGALTNYGRIAETLGSHPRAVGAAVGANPIALFVPCHRVVHATGEADGYRWGNARKSQLLKAEGSTGYSFKAA
ncbi:MAG: methylated-DNA--[protein]-cysteine S-methyltransferase [Opitutales bacterium]